MGQQIEQQELVVRGLEVGRHYGKSVSLCEGWLAVGAPARHASRGSVFVFKRRPNGAWKLHQELEPWRPLEAEYFGEVAISENALIASGPIGGDTYGAHGRVHIFERGPNDEWTHVFQQAPNTVDILGYALDIEGDTAVATSFGDGKVHVYKRSGPGAWSETEVLMTPPAEGWHGQDVDLEGNRMVVAGTNAAAGAAVYVYERGAQGWQEVARIDRPADVATGFVFAFSVRLSGDRIAVGATGRLLLGDAPGMVLIFERDAQGVWQETVRLRASDASGRDHFGSSLALQGDRLVVGASAADLHAVPTGVFYVFEHRAGSGWREVHKLADSDLTGSLGHAVDLEGDLILTGDTSGSQGGVNTGSAHVYEWPVGSRTCDANANSRGIPAFAYATGSALASEGPLELRASFLPEDVLGFFIVSRQPGFVPSFRGGSGNLCVAQPFVRLAPQHSGPGGTLHTSLDLQTLGAAAGETWHFQAWYRDRLPSNALTSNLTNGLAVTFE